MAKRKLTIPLPDRDFETVLVCAVRYACGRSTYMPGLVQDWIIDHCAGCISPATLNTIIRDIDEETQQTIQYGTAYGSKQLFDHDHMTKLREWCEQEGRR